MAFWATENEGTLAVGDVGFVVERSHEGVDVTQVWKLPARTNMSHEAKLRGYCGETNNIVITARGACEILRRSTRDPDRVQVRALADDDQRVVDLWEELAE
jgi:hypothetical protein